MLCALLLLPAQTLAQNPATGAPTISGTLQVGQTLTASTANIDDQDGLNNVIYVYQWIRVNSTDADIPGATSNSYMLVTADTGKTIKVRVTFDDDLNNTESLTSAETGTVNAAPTGAPTISGTLQVGATLTASTASITDPNGLTSVNYTYQWIRVNTDIPGATSSSYMLVTADTGKTIKVRVTFDDDDGFTESLTSAETGTVNAAPTGAPTISGTLQVGATLTASTASITDPNGLTSVNYTYQWIRVNTDIPGATSSSYMLVTADTGKTIKVRVTFDDDDGFTESLTSAETGTVNAAPTGAPTISGTLQVGATLTASTASITDPNGLTSVNYTYQWIRVNTDIPGATSSSYMLVTADTGKTIKVRVTFDDDDGFTESLTSAETGTVNAAPTGAPTISGTLQVGATLTASTASITDPNGLTSVNYTYQWIRVNTDIPGATSSSYMLVTADTGKTIKVRVTFDDDDGFTESLTSAETGTVNAAPTGAPTISGTLQVGATLTASTASITDPNGLTSVNYTYQWIRVNTDIPGATSSSYMLVTADTGKTIKVRVTFDDDDGFTESLTSAETGTVNAAPTGAPTISGTLQVGATLTASTASITDPNGLTSVNYTYQWIRVNTDIPGATSSSYMLVTADTGKTIKVRVTFDDDDGFTESLTSAETGTVNAAPTGAPTISGTLQVGATLTASTASITDPNGLTSVNYTYQWIRVNTDIPGATSSSYMLVTADTGKTIKVRVTFDDDDGFTESLTSAETGTVNAAPTGAPTISGTLQVGATLTASTASITDPNGLTNVSYAYQWIRVNSTDADISGATSSSYMLVTADTGKTIRVRVTFDDDDGFTESLTSAETMVVGPRITVPDAPSNLLADGTDEAVTLAWDPPEDDGGAAITDYQYRINGRNPWISIGSTDTTHTVTGLVNGTKYVLEVRAVNRIGKGFSSNRAEATPEAPEVFMDFAHFANGTSITSDLVLVNVAPQPVRPAIYFYDTEGAPIAAESVLEVTADLEIQEDGGLTVQTEMDPLAVLTISTHGQGELVSGSVKVVSEGLSIGGGLRYNLPAIGEAVVRASPAVRDVLFPARRQAGGINTAVAIHNLGEEAMEARCELMREGVLRDFVSISLEANGQTSWMIDQAFPAADMSDFTGSVRCDAVGQGLFSAVALEVDPGTRIFTTLPLFPVDRGGGGREAVLDFAHFVNGTWITDLVFVNLSTEASRPAPSPFHTAIPPSRPVIYFYDTEGALVAPESVVDVTGDLEITEDGALTVQTEMEPLGVLTISTHGRGELVSGSVRVVSDGPIGGMLRFEHPAIGEAVVGAVPPLSDALFPVRRQEGGINTGVALHNLESSPGLVRCELLREGVLLDAVPIALEANGQTSWLIDQAFPAADTSDFAGAVRCDAVGQGLFSAVALEMDPVNRIFATLPVVPVPEMPDQE